MTNKTDYYSILQVSSDATNEDIKLSFRRLARKYHPDLNPGDPETAERFKLISSAYETLSDQSKRTRYDREQRLSRKQSSRTTVSKSYSSTYEYPPKTAGRGSQDFFSRGLNNSKAKKYQKAIKEFSKAIELDPSFIDAYLKRCEMRYKLGDNQGVLDDCYRIIQISPSVPKAYYYQGRARFSLGYSQAAVDSHSEAIRQDKDYAQAYYYRGIAYQDIKDNSLAIEDWNIASKLFQKEGNKDAYQLTQKKIKSVNSGDWGLNSFLVGFTSLISDSLTTFLTYFLNPMGGLLTAFNRLSSSQALGIGLFYGICTDLCLTMSGYIITGSSLNFVPTISPLNAWELMIINFFPFIFMVIFSICVRLIHRIQSDLAHDIFLAGATCLPLGIACLLMSLFANSHGVSSFSSLLFLIFGLSYGILTLFAGLTQIIRLSEGKSSFFSPLIIIISFSLYSFVNSIFIGN